MPHNPVKYRKVLAEKPTGGIIHHFLFSTGGTMKCTQTDVNLIMIDGVVR